jgi:hypothetical protein
MQSQLHHIVNAVRLTHPRFAFLSDDFILEISQTVFQPEVITIPSLPIPSLLTLYIKKGIPWKNSTIIPRCERVQMLTNK